jgi:hypothetical protein
MVIFHSYVSLPDGNLSTTLSPYINAHLLQLHWGKTFVQSKLMFWTNLDRVLSVSITGITQFNMGKDDTPYPLMAAPQVLFW